MAEYASNAVANAGLTTGIIGTALGVLGGGLVNILNGTGMVNYQNGGGYVTRETFEMAQKVAEKDSQIALLKFEQNTEVKIADVYERLANRINDEVRRQGDINAAQAVYNATNNSAVSVLQTQVAALTGMTKLYIPAVNVTPEPMPLKNSWTAPTV